MLPHIEMIGKTYGPLPAWALMFLLIFLRYAVLASIFYFFFYLLFRKRFFRFKIQEKYPRAAEIGREIGYSLATAAIFASMAFGVFALRKMGLGKLYFDIGERGWGYYAFSLAFVIVLHDAYFYWIHRLMHHPRLFRHFHRVHHLSHNPTPYTAFSFHPLEAIVEFGIVPIIALFMPIHSSALFIFTLWSIAFNVFGHTGFEFAPSGATRHPIWKWLGTPTHHNLHHQQANYNFSLYFNWWDRWMGTNNPRYDEVFENVKRRPK
jgi:sterol desaturase/sphingolipid hydroxylase (fatty acid hydroxylase superfamily)